MMRRKFLFLWAVLFGATILGAPTQAHAAFTLTIGETGAGGATIGSVNVMDNGPGDLSSASGLIVFAGTVGDFSIQVSIGSSNGALGVQPAQLTINNLSISTAGFTGTRKVTITLQDTGFTVPAMGLQANMLSQLSSTYVPANTNVTFQSFLNGSGGTLLTLNTVGGTSANNTVIIPTNPYTLADVTTYTVQGQGIGTGLDVQTTGITQVAVPAPAGVVLALAGFPFAGFGCWVQRRKKA